MTVLLGIGALAVCYSVFLTVKNVKLSVNNTKLKKENINMQYELSKILFKDKEI